MDHMRLQVEIVSALDHANELYIVVAGGVSQGLDQMLMCSGCSFLPCSWCVDSIPCCCIKSCAAA
jgi:hypothetical protein